MTLKKRGGTLDRSPGHYILLLTFVCIIAESEDVKKYWTGVKEEHDYNHVSNDGVYCMQYSPDGSFIAVGYGDSGLEVCPKGICTCDFH